MADEETEQTAPRTAKDTSVEESPRSDPGVVEGQGEARAEPPSSPGAGVPAPPRSGGGARAVFAGGLAGLIVAAAAVAGAYSFYPPKAELDAVDANRLAAVEAQAKGAADAMEAEAKREKDAAAGLDKRVAALENSGSNSGVAALDAGVAALDKRVAALEAASAAAMAKIAAAADGAGQAEASVKDLRADAQSAAKAIPALDARVAKLESAAPQAASSAEVSALAARFDKLDASVSAQKQALAERAKAADNVAAVGIVADALRDKLRSGAAYPAELAALDRLGVDPAKLEPLKVLVNGAPTGHALALSFEKVAPKALTAATPEDKAAGPMDRFLAHVRGLVRVRDLSETSGDDPAALVTQIVAASNRGDLAAALAAFAKLPEPARKAAAGWAAEAGARQAADAALQSIREAAIGRLAGGDKS